MPPEENLLRTSPAGSFAVEQVGCTFGCCQPPKIDTKAR
jgi:hypothetical protein